MRRFVITPPTEWIPLGPGQFRVNEVTVTVGELLPLPEDVRAFVGAKLGQAALDSLTSVRLAGGWPAFAARAPGKILVILRALEHGVVVRLEGEAERLEASRSAILAIIGAGQLEWDEPPFWTVAELLDGVQRGT